MDLLVQQMKNQDPMNPQSNDQFIAQLASFSSLEQMQNMNDNLLTMAVVDAAYRSAREHRGVEVAEITATAIPSHK